MTTPVEDSPQSRPAPMAVVSTSGDLAGESDELWGYPSVKALLAANLLPILGVAFLGWEIRAILLIYWCESAVIGFYNAMKMLKRGGLGAVPFTAFFIVHYGLFMLVHLVFVIVLTQRESWDEGLSLSAFWRAFDAGVITAVIGLVVSHGVSYYTNFLRRREYETASVLRRLDRIVERHGTEAAALWRSQVNAWGPAECDRNLRLMGLMTQMFSPYSRIVLMQVTLIGGVLAMMLLGWTHWALLLLWIAAKTAVDLRAHAREHGLGRHRLAATGL